MKVVILAGGFGTRISEESHLVPKPMIEIGERPLLWHIMKQYSFFGYHDFIICSGYKQHVIKEFFSNYSLYTSDITFDLSNNSTTLHNRYTEPWRVTVVDTGLNTMTGGRVKRIKDYIGDETFMLTYGDAVSDVNINDLVAYHHSHKKTATLTAVQPGGRFGLLEINDDSTINRFTEKVKEEGGWINSGYMVLEPAIFDLIDGDATVFEKEPLERATAQGNLVAYCHNGFWQCMDTMREKALLEELWQSGEAPWKLWKE